MPLQPSDYDQKFIGVDVTESLKAVLERIAERNAGDDWGLFVTDASGVIGVLPVSSLPAIHRSLGQGVVGMSMAALKEWFLESVCVDRKTIGVGQAKQFAIKSKAKLVIVMDGNEIVGRLAVSQRGETVAPPEPCVAVTGAKPLPFAESEPKPPQGLEAAKTPAVAEQRCVHAQLRHGRLPRHHLPPGADNVIRCWIGLPEPDAGAVADTPVPTVDLPPEGLTLDAVLRWRDQTDHGKLYLPSDRTARSNDCDLHIHVPDDERFVSAEIAFLYRGRVFEVVQVEAFVLSPGAAAHPHHTVEVNVQVAQREVVEFAGSSEVNAVMVYGEDRTLAGGPGDRGPTNVRVYGRASGTSFNLNDPQKVIDYLNTELFVAETSLVRRRVKQGQRDEVLDTEDSDVLRILRTLARHGATLYNSLGDGFKDPGPRIQLQNRDLWEYSPVEFVYDLGFPTTDTDELRICPDGLAALESDADNCPHCPPADELPAELRIANPTICPFGFWSLQKIIERRDVVPQGSEAFGGQSFPLPNRRHLPPIDSVLFASSDKVELEERDRTWQSLKALLPYAEHALSWTEWRQSLVSRVSSILLALPHHGVEEGLDYLEVGDEHLPEEDRRLFRSQLIKEFVNPCRLDPGPIVLLLGCRTVAPTDLGYVDMARSFQQLPVSIVLGTLGQVLGRHAAPVAREIVAQLASVDDADTDFGTIMRRVRRRMLARGYLMALCLVSLGDAEWRLTPNKTTNQKGGSSVPNRDAACSPR